MWRRAYLLAVLFLCTLIPYLASAQNARVTVVPLSTGITTDTTSAVVDIPNGRKSVSGYVSCTAGACTQTQAIYGTNGTTATVAKAQLLCTLTLSGTSTDYDTCPVITAAFARFFVVTTSTTGTNATGVVYVAY